MGQQQTPLYDALVRHRQHAKWSFHVPGHKNGTIGYERNETFSSMLPFDVTELTGLDDLHEPAEAIHEAQQLTADFYNVRHSYFLVGGSTAGNLVMLFSAFKEGDVVLIQRNCHKSVLNGLELAGLKPVFLPPEVDPAGQFATGLSLSSVKKALDKYPDAKGILLTSPNYYGMVLGLAEIIEYMHQKELVVLVDEAHGAHLGHSPYFPDGAIKAGADMVVHSAHKTLPAMTMGAYLHSNSFRIDENRVRHYLQALQSSSPSYPIMASLDLARAYTANLSSNDFKQIKLDSDHFRNSLNELVELCVLEASPGCELDPLKVTVQSTRGLSGYELQHIFEKKGIYTELSDPSNVLFVLPLGKIPDLAEIIEKIKEAVSEGMFHEEQFRQISLSVPPGEISALEKSYKELAQMETDLVFLKEAEGLIAAEAIIPYPPGIPLIAKGERITADMIKEYQYLSCQGARFHGGQEHKIYVFAEQKEEC
ncbi:aminotransferase class I/II-fold pyridoxal phosphate-dependent enzyme [Fictibacillus fluitans]|uniref:Aminotransferase class I/II-fold pyridoxal phosphate-dependent enzyme n=1 Tax=Fictibacillus fluitans TaxID=3058422 RepID=A0ABT8I359_9BACL|nr:aminotransferase class I/II-fold pyridoxal phosphate-dependent enzyme [Fictibacillus sp. NE201]MDN4527421.1 aminotransferase class I/II-fold pyridoxal phosphate-dependent enzyme [Fictibacillus sp. NE201]